MNHNIACLFLFQGLENKMKWKEEGWRGGGGLDGLSAYLVEIPTGEVRGLCPGLLVDSFDSGLFIII